MNRLPLLAAAVFAAAVFLLTAAPATSADPAAPATAPTASRPASQPVAELTLPRFFADHMVLQRGMKTPVWGWAKPGDKISVSIAGQSADAAADAEGYWLARVGPLEAGGPHELVVKTDAKAITLTDVLIGDVWICSGQSNMELPVAGATGGGEEATRGQSPQLRQLYVPRTTAATPQANINAKWAVASPKNVGDWSAVGYYFGRQLQGQFKVPIGIVNVCWGGSNCETWTSREALDASVPLKRLLHAMDARDAAAKSRAATNPALASQPAGPGMSGAYNSPCAMYNAMIAPLIPYGIKGAIWYQGESNAYDAKLYRTLFPAMIADWRGRWGQGDFPFLYVQLANFMQRRAEPSDGGWAKLREAQLMTLAVPNTAMAVIIDVGDAKDIHPRDKQTVAMRLALAARRLAYGQDIEWSGPIYKSMAVEGDKIRVKFDHVGGGLVEFGGRLTGFAIAGEDGKFVWADAMIDGDTVVVSSPKVAKPTAVRYAWADNPLCNLYNKDNLPASPFRTDSK